MILTLVIFFSCEKPLVYDTSDVSISTLSLSRDAHDTTFTITAPADWNIQVNKSAYCDSFSLYPMSGGEGKHTITLSTKENRNFVNISNVLSYTSSNRAYQIKVTQKRTVEPKIKDVQLDYKAGDEKNLTISTEWSWRLIGPAVHASNHPWIRFNVRSDGHVEDKLYQINSRTLNPSQWPRIDTLHFIMDSAQFTERILNVVVRQKGNPNGTLTPWTPSSK
jgi:hypothetical protein